jgi:hypothetical protein
MYLIIIYYYFFSLFPPPLVSSKSPIFGNMFYKHTHIYIYMCVCVWVAGARVCLLQTHSSSSRVWCCHWEVLVELEVPYPSCTFIYGGRRLVLSNGMRVAGIHHFWAEAFQEAVGTFSLLFLHLLAGNKGLQVTQRLVVPQDGGFLNQHMEKSQLPTVNAWIGLLSEWEISIMWRYWNVVFICYNS